jgi:anti-sigma factor RsiW
MNVSRDVILDLLPVYLAGEASPATRALVDEFLAGDPDLARRVREQQLEAPGDRATASPPPELELVALRRARRMVAVQRWLFGIGLALTAVSLGIVIETKGGRLVSAHLLMQDFPAPFVSMLILGVACLVANRAIGRRLRGTRD